MADHPKIVALDRYQTGESANPSPEKILAGIPRARVSNQFTDPTQQFFCGFWSSTSGKWRVRYTEHELCVLIEGRVRLESVAGREARIPRRRCLRRARRATRAPGKSPSPARSGTRSSRRRSEALAAR